MKKRKFLGLVSTVLMTAVLVAACGSGAGQKPTADAGKDAAQGKAEGIKIGYVNLIAAAPAIVAKEKGLIDKQGLKAEFFSFANGPDLYKALSSGKLDVAYAGMPAAVNWGSRGAQFKVIAKVDDGKFGLLTKDSSGIKQPADLKGKKLGTLVKGSGVDYLIRAMILPEGQLTEQTTSLVQLEMGNMEQAINSGTIDAAVAGEPFLTFAELRGLKVVKEVPDPAFVILASDSFLKDHKDAADKFLQGHIASVDELNKNSKDNAELLAKAFNVPEISANGKTYSPGEVMAQALKRNKFETKFTDNDMKFYQEVADNSLKLKSIDQPLDVKTIMDRSWIK
ncbi:ABC transporter substrate-binding protein [Paenibacillus sp. UNC451MF]|uniref:ABC transporter substrate-binding protein n=1 Tax=Paenibacillus sp. UNC451MF TaxID=1449063 RepID=UPI0004900296|nr:ABC transporter substrate-binding protein [Paenibacillus sp. UNC451MF]